MHAGDVAAAPTLDKCAYLHLYLCLDALLAPFIDLEA